MRSCPHRPVAVEIRHLPPLHQVEVEVAISYGRSDRHSLLSGAPACAPPWELPARRPGARRAGRCDRPPRVPVGPTSPWWPSHPAPRAATRRDTPCPGLQFAAGAARSFVLAIERGDDHVRRGHTPMGDTPGRSPPPWAGTASSPRGIPVPAANEWHESARRAARTAAGRPAPPRSSPRPRRRASKESCGRCRRHATCLGCRRAGGDPTAAAHESSKCRAVNGWRTSS